jgi:hypothetical protein
MYVPETFEYDRSGGSSAHARTPQCLLTPVLSLGLGHILFYKLENVSLSLSRVQLYVETVLGVLYIL